MIYNTTGIILSGGKSSRMGVNKSLLQLGEYKVIEHVTNLAKSIFKNVILITNKPDEYTFLNIPMFKDFYSNVGPLAGIHSGLKNSNTENNFFFSCDTPLITEEIVKYIINYQTNSPLVICKADGFKQYLTGRFSKILIPKIDTFLNSAVENIEENNRKKRNTSLKLFLSGIKYELIDLDKVDFYEKGTFFNINKPEDYNEILKKY